MSLLHGGPRLGGQGLLGLGPTLPSNLTSYPFGDQVLLLAAALLCSCPSVAPEVLPHLSFACAGLPAGRANSPSSSSAWSGPTAVLTWEAFPRNPGLARSPGHLPPLPWACSIFCLGVFVSWIQGPLPSSLKCLEGKNHFGSSSEVTARPDTKQVLRNIHSFISAIRIHSDHLLSPCYVLGTVGYKTKLLPLWCSVF